MNFADSFQTREKEKGSLKECANALLRLMNSVEVDTKAAARRTT
jgi:hypothetical protein